MNRSRWARRIAVAAGLAAALTGASPVRETPADDDAPTVPLTPPPAVVEPPPLRPPEIVAPGVPPLLPEDKGRVALEFEGNRRWCTYPDDRVVKPPERDVPARRKQVEVWTFGYRFSLAAIRRGAPRDPIVLFESPDFRTATWRPASKLRPEGRTAAPGPSVMGEGPGARSRQRTAPDTLVPYWMEVNRCVTVPDRFQFDLDPGVYDFYMAFDLLIRDGSWVHRSMAHLTEVPVEAARRTRLEGRIHMKSGAERELELSRASVETTGSASGAAGP
ncbi:MAG: hypothetical protein ACRD6R_13415 [Candidatus Polarisedimenticolia bacterium]